MQTILNTIFCFLNLHNWTVNNKPVGEKSTRQCIHCSKRQETTYSSINDTTIWKDISRKQMNTINEGGRLPNAGPRVRCLKCMDVIQSMYRHDFKWCKCNNIAVDGGGDYLKMSYQTGAQYEIIKEEKEEN